MHIDKMYKIIDSLRKIESFLRADLRVIIDARVHFKKEG